MCPKSFHQQLEPSRNDIHWLSQELCWDGGHNSPNSILQFFECLWFGAATSSLTQPWRKSRRVSNLITREWLDARFPGRCLGRRGPHEWPSKSPDLTPCDFLLWGWAKEEVYLSKPKTLEELEDRIRGVMSTMPAEFLRKLVDANPGRLQQLVERSGAHIEF